MPASSPLSHLAAVLRVLRARLRRRIPARPVFEAAASRWEADGRPATHLPTGYAFLRLTCWDNTTGEREARSDTLRAWIAAARSLDVNIAGYNALLRERDYCSGCHEGTYRLENLAICVHCPAVWCFACSDGLARTRHANGNRVCTCGGEIVG